MQLIEVRKLRVRRDFMGKTYGGKNNVEAAGLTFSENVRLA